MLDSGQTVRSPPSDRPHGSARIGLARRGVSNSAVARVASTLTLGASLYYAGRSARVLRIQDVPYKVLVVVLQYMYNCLEEIDENMLMDVFKASRDYGIPSLHSDCLQHLTSMMDLTNSKWPSGDQGYIYIYIIERLRNPLPTQRLPAAPHQHGGPHLTCTTGLN
eukprot:1180150-Prorocentrum_minimum.AAC.2